MRILVFLISLLIFVSLLSTKSSAEWNSDSLIGDVLIALGDTKPDHARPNASEEEIKRGYDLVYYGKTTDPKGKRSSYISKYYMCTSCHNQVQEDPDLTKSDPEKRLDYLSEKGLKFLQASTFYGIANRERWYGGDYYKKYGDLVKPANKSLAEATQLCAKVCSSGRYLDDWELEAILAYYWTMQMKLSDLELSEGEMKDVLISLEKGKNSDELVKLLKSKYLTELPVEFGELPQRMDLGYEHEGNAENGKKIYELSCQACHQKGGVSTVLLEDDKATMKKFVNHLSKNTDFNLYNIIRHGTYIENGKPRYMPLYPKEKLSDQQIEDLRAYIEDQAKN